MKAIRIETRPCLLPAAVALPAGGSARAAAGATGPDVGIAREKYR